jgi:hypothetical protein
MEKNVRLQETQYVQHCNGNPCLSGTGRMCIQWEATRFFLLRHSGLTDSCIPTNLPQQLQLEPCLVRSRRLIKYSPVATRPSGRRRLSTPPTTSKERSSHIIPKRTIREETISVSPATLRLLFSLLLPSALLFPNMGLGFWNVGTRRECVMEAM